MNFRDYGNCANESPFNDRLSINAMVCQFVLLTLHSVCTNVQRCYRLHLDATECSMLNALLKGYSSLMKFSMALMNVQ